MRPYLSGLQGAAWASERGRRFAETPIGLANPGGESRTVEGIFDLAAIAPHVLFDRYRVGMFAGRRYAFIGTIAALVWFICVLIFWAFQPMTDSVPVGVDYTLKIPAVVSVSVDCNGLFDSALRDNSPLPALKAQPKGKPKLAFEREPCAVVHHQARIVLALDTAGVVAVMLAFGWLTLRWRRASSAAAQKIDSGFVGLPAG